MDEREKIESTPVFQLYEKGKNYLRLTNHYDKVNQCLRFYKGDQWHNAQFGDVLKVQYNMIKPIVNYKTSSLDSYEYQIVYKPNNYATEEKQQRMEEICKMLNTHTAIIWEHKHMETVLRKVKKMGAIAGEDAIYFYFKKDKDKKTDNGEMIDDVMSGEFEAERINTTDIYYGNENDDKIETQPYILIKQRKPLLEVQEEARENGISEEEIDKIGTDRELAEEAGDAAQYEVEDNVLCVTKFYKKNGTVHCVKSTRSVIYQKEMDLKLKRYPIAHFNWSDDVGSARGIGEVEYLIPNQIEVNKTLVRRVAILTMIAYPKIVVNTDKIKNPAALNKTGAVIELSGGIDNINNYFGYVQPSQTSPEASALQSELISMTRELANASDIATGAINPEHASGKSILAVQQASQQPLNEPLYRYKELLEDIALIIFDIWRAYNVKGMNLYKQKEKEDLSKIDDGVYEYQLEPITGQELEELEPFITIEETPRTAYDRLAQEQSYENLLVKNMISFEEFVELLGEDSTLDKHQLTKLVQKRQEKQRQINEMQQQVQAQANDLQNEMQTEQMANQVETDVDINRINDNTEAQAQAMLEGVE